MNIVLLSGGSGKRLWPLSNDVRSKQFLKLFKNDNGEYESMIQRMYNGIKKVNENASITVATAKTQASVVYNQLSNNVSISIEPCRKDTFPAILLASAYLADVKGVSLEEAVVVCPVDPYVNDDYFKTLGNLSKIAKDGKSNIILLGIEPTYPSEKYGYIIPSTTNDVSNVLMFKEKPKEEQAKEYIENGALWNGGIFAFKLGYILKRGHELIEFEDYYDLYNKYETLNKISFDYAILEQEKSISVLRFDGSWIDLGTWNSLSEMIDDNIIGKGVIDESSHNVKIVNELNLPILCMGLTDTIVAASPDGILVSSKDASSKMKSYVESIKNPIMFAEKSWGSYRVINATNDSMTILVTLTKDNQMSYHYHQNRNEIWNVIEGLGTAIIDGKYIDLKPGNTLTIKEGSIHTVIAKTSELKIVEVQIGKEIDVNDKVKCKMIENK